MIPEIASKTPDALSIDTRFLLIAQPNRTIKQVFVWPTMVEDTGPVFSMMMNWVKFITAAHKPDYE